MLSKLKFYDREDRRWPTLRLTSSAIVGHTTQTTARIWIRVWEVGEYCLCLSEDRIDTDFQPELTSSKQVMLKAGGKKSRTVALKFVETRKIGYETDLTTVFDVEGLKPGKRYFYAAFYTGNRRERWEIGRDEDHSFTTQNPEAEKITFGLFSCHMPFKGRNVLNMHMWDNFHELLEDMQGDFVIGCGDQVYSDGDDNVSLWQWLKEKKNDISKLSKAKQLEVMVSGYRDIYRGYWGDHALRRVFRNFPTYMIWDDHEIMDGWGSYTTKELSDRLDTVWEWENTKKNLSLAYNMFEAAKQVYKEYQHSHNPTTPHTKNQWDYNFDWNGLAFYVLDMRGNRDYNRAQNKILGTPQLQRFRTWLKSKATADADALFVVSPVPMVHLKDFVTNTLDLPALGLADDLRDEWEHKSNYPERNRVLEAVFNYSDRAKKPVVFLSGDVHVGAAFKLNRKGKNGAQVFQLTSSPITFCKAPGKLLRLTVKENGRLSGLPENQRTSIKRLHVFEDNNFGLVHCHKQSGRRGQIKLAWDLYGSTGREDEVVRLKRIKLAGYN